jgi:hypothetical protein
VGVLNIAIRHPVYRAASAEQVVVVGFFGHAELAHVEAVDEHLRECERRSAKGLGFLFVIGEGSPIPPAAVRSRATAFMRSLAPHVKVFATIIRGSGFTVAAKRSVFSMMVSGAVSSMRFKVFSEPGEACAWFAAECASLGISCPKASALAEDVTTLGSEG